MVALGGLALSLSLAETNVWSMATLSHLGSDPGAGPAFRVTLLLVGIIQLALAWQLGPVLARMRGRGQIRPRWAAWYTIVFWTVGFAFIGVGLLSLGVAPLVELAHGTAAYAIPVAVLTVMLTATIAVPSLGSGFGRVSLLVLAAVLLLYVAAVASIVSYAVMETVAFGAGAVWYFVFVDRLVRISAD